MPYRVSLWRGALLALGGAVSFGCNATCIRDSDCLGQSVCTENRCILITRRDAGTSRTPASDEPGDGGSGGSNAGDAPSAPDAGE